MLSRLTDIGYPQIRACFPCMPHSKSTRKFNQEWFVKTPNSCCLISPSEFGFLHPEFSFWIFKQNRGFDSSHSKFYKERQINYSMVQTSQMIWHKLLLRYILKYPYYGNIFTTFAGYKGYTNNKSWKWTSRNLFIRLYKICVTDVFQIFLFPAKNIINLDLRLGKWSCGKSSVIRQKGESQNVRVSIRG